MGLKLFKKYFLATAAVVLFTLTFMMMILTVVFSNHLSVTKYESLTKACESVADFSRKIEIGNDPSFYDSPQFRSFRSVLLTIKQASDQELLFADVNGSIRFCSCDDWSPARGCPHSKHLVSKETMDKANARSGQGMESLGIYEEARYTAYTPIVDANNQKIGVVYATAPLTAIRSFLMTMVRLYLLSAIVPLVMMFFLIYAINYRMTKPLRLMSAATKAMAKGDFSKRIPVTSDDEIGELAVSFNRMTNSLAQLEGMRRSFVANVSHELKTPMTTIGGFIDGIMDGTIEKEKQNYYLNIVSEEVKRLSRLVESMLNVAKLESGELQLKTETFNFGEQLIRVVVGQEQRIVAKQIEITGLDGIEEVRIKADKDLIHQVVYNLVDNAIKFTPDGGIIDFKLRVDGKKMYFSLKNTGDGIPSESLPLVFERFYKVDKSRSINKKGTGLGLYIVKTIVRAHDGTVTVSSRENEQTVFEVMLPLE